MSKRLLCALLLFVLSCKNETSVSDTAATTTTAVAETVATETVPPPPPSPPTEPEPLLIATANNADENLFMVQLLHAYYGDLPGSKASRNQVQEWLATARANAKWAREVISSRELDQDIDTLYENYANFLDAYENYLVRVGLIAQRSDGQAVADLGASAWKGYKTSGDVADFASAMGASKDDADNAGAWGGLLYGLYEYSEREKQRTAARDAAIEESQRALNASLNDIRTRSRSTVRMLARRHGWHEGEAGFDDFESKYFSEYMKRRPRDPFLKIAYAQTRAKKETAENVLQDAWTAVAATSLVPADHAYDAIRADYFIDSADLAGLAASTQAGEGGYSAHPPLAATALSFARGALAADPRDNSGRGHAALARALAFSGRYREAVENASIALDRARESWRSDSTFCYRLAAYLSLENEHLDYVGPWLKQAYANGFNNLALIRDSPDFENYRQTYADEYKSLTTANVTYDIVYGVFNDDIVLYNRSPFPITNLHVTMTIRKGDRVWTPDLRCNSLASGESCKAVDVVSIPNDQYDDLSWTLACDQCPS